MKDYIIKDGKKLKLGYTTGSCAAAASKAALWMLLSGRKKDKIKLTTPKGIELELDVSNIVINEKYVSCSIKKDSGDDPDITNGAHIFSKVELSQNDGVEILGGEGIGIVTKPGLDQKVGQYAINSVPRQMITKNVEEVCQTFDYRGGVKVTISVPKGKTLSEKTFNPRLGIKGGISILGTTGIVEPMSEKALVDTIKIELKQRRESGANYVLLTPGNYGADFIKHNISAKPNLAVLTSNFIGDALDICAELGFCGVLLVGHVGKLVKLAGGMMNTHSKYGDCRMEIIATHASMQGADSSIIKEIKNSVMCDEAIRILKEKGLFKGTLNSIADKISSVMNNRVSKKFETGAILFSKEYGLLCETKNARILLDKITEE